MPPTGARVWSAEREGLSSLRSDIPRREVLAFTAHAGTSFLAFFILEFAQASLAHPQIKNAPVGGMGLVCGERGIRTPGPVTVNGFQDRRNRPLCHLSAAKVHPKGLEGY